MHFGPVHFVTDLTYFIISNQKKGKQFLILFLPQIKKKIILVIKNKNKIVKVWLMPKHT